MRRPDHGCGVRWFGPEVDPATGTELGLLPDHAGCNALHAWDLGTAQAERIAHAGLLLLERVSPALHRNDAQ